LAERSNPDRALWVAGRKPIRETVVRRKKFVAVADALQALNNRIEDSALGFRGEGSRHFAHFDLGSILARMNASPEHLRSTPVPLVLERFCCSLLQLARIPVILLCRAQPSLHPLSFAQQKLPRPASEFTCFGYRSINYEPLLVCGYWNPQRFILA
jgi:hypothetical protein